MVNQLKEYRSPDIVVTFDSTRCIHSAVCLRTLPDVFDVNARPWVQPNAATADAVADAVMKCPSGALKFERLDGGAAEVPGVEAAILPLKNGPLLVRGAVALLDAAGQPVPAGFRMALCRCGQSANKPFCDNSHRRVGFRSE